MPNAGMFGVKFYDPTSGRAMVDGPFVWVRFDGPALFACSPGDLGEDDTSTGGTTIAIYFGGGWMLLPGNEVYQSITVFPWASGPVEIDPTLPDPND